MLTEFSTTSYFETLKHCLVLKKINTYDNDVCTYIFK